MQEKYEGRPKIILLYFYNFPNTEGEIVLGHI